MSDPMSFSYVDVELDVSAASVTCRYRLGTEEFVEVTVLPGADLGAPGAREAAELYFLLAGVSYFKTAAPLTIHLGELATTADERTFLRQFYLEGLGEYSLKNGLDLSELTIEGPERADARAVGRFDAGRVLIPFGGGLDSIVTVAELTPLCEEAALFVAERPGARVAALEGAAAVTGLRVRRAERSLDPKVFESAARGYRNGHVPVTGILSALAVLAAVAGGFGAVAMSNERSASSATTTGPAGPVNHQWSKGLEFEVGFRGLLASRLAGFEYFSWLRDRSELSIAARFAELREYHHVFRSCNRAFHQDPAARLEDWCGVCDKCLFIDLALSPHLDATELRAIFGGAEPLENPALRDQLAVLVGAAGGTRPFECVGDEAECAEALLATVARPDRASNTMLAQLAAQVTAPAPPARAERTFIPERYAPSSRLD